MKFTVTFTTEHEKLTLFDNIQNPGGKELLKIAREETGIPTLKPDQVSKDCNLQTRKTGIELAVKGKYTKEMMEHPVFTHFENIKVVVPEGWFGQFVYDRVVIHRYGYSENFIAFIYQKLFEKERPLRHITVTSDCNWDMVMDSWVMAGMPHYWGTTEERHTEMRLREIACEEERKRKQAEAKREENRKHNEALEKKRIADRLLARTDLGYFSKELVLMAEKLKEIQELYDK
jgi:hypothetical protein